ncbi:sensor domain-containing protein, partial [Mycobacterium avium]
TSLDLTQRDNMLTANTSLRGAPATCQRAMTAKRNVVIDVTACSGNPADSGVALASMIAERMGQPA